MNEEALEVLAKSYRYYIAQGDIYVVRILEKLIKDIEGLND